MSLQYTDKVDLALRLETIESSMDADIRLVGSILERVGRAKKEAIVIKEELERRNG